MFGQGLDQGLVQEFFPALFRATAWWLDLPTSTPIKTSMASCSLIMTHLIPRATRAVALDETTLARPTAPRPGIHVTTDYWTGAILSGSGPYLRCPWCFSNPGDSTPPNHVGTGVVNHAGIDRPVTPILAHLEATKRVTGEAVVDGQRHVKEEVLLENIPRSEIALSVMYWQYFVLHPRFTAYRQ